MFSWRAKWQIGQNQEKGEKRRAAKRKGKTQGRQGEKGKGGEAREGTLACSVQGCLELPRALLHCCIGRFPGFDFCLVC